MGAGKLIGRNFKKGRTCKMCNIIIEKAERYHRSELNVPVCCMPCFFKADKKAIKVVYAEPFEHKPFAQLLTPTQPKGGEG